MLTQAAAQAPHAACWQLRESRASGGPVSCQVQSVQMRRGAERREWGAQERRWKPSLLLPCRDVERTAAPSVTIRLCDRDCRTRARPGSGSRCVSWVTDGARAAQAPLLSRGFAAQTPTPTAGGPRVQEGDTRLEKADGPR